MRHCRKPLLLLACALLSAPALADESVEALIKRQSQEFSDASASGDAKVLARYLDERVVFMNEDGSLATKKDIVEGAGPQPAGVHNRLTQTDFAVQVHGDVAVTSFTDQLDQDYHGQPFRENFRSTEIWLKARDGWKMISSQTLAVPEDPAAIALPPAALDEYAGTYQLAPELNYVISRNGAELSGGMAGTPARAMKAEVRDVFFTPGAPRLRKLFQRDADGKITGFFSRREGHDLWFKRMG